jgi:fimbrial chaperone protein
MNLDSDVSRRVAVRLLLGAASGLLLSSRARAAALQVTPVIVELVGGARASIVQVDNRGGGATTMQVRTFSWTQSSDDDVLVPTDQLAASPPIFVIPEGGSQIVRLVLRAAPEATEQHFRVMLDEIPGPVQGMAVTVALRVSLPIVVVPASAPPPMLRWGLESGRDGKPRIAATNAGGRYARIAELRLGLSGGEALPVRQIGQTPYVLPNSTRYWLVSDPRQTLRPGASVTLSGKTNFGAFEEKVVLK